MAVLVVHGPQQRRLLGIVSHDLFTRASLALGRPSLRTTMQRMRIVQSDFRGLALIEQGADDGEGIQRRLASE
jgi:hypothetical protein